MAGYHRVWSSIWTEPWTEDARTLALYLLTCEHRITEGLYRLPKAYIATDLAWSEERVGSAFDELIDAPFIRYDDRAQVVLIVGALKRQPPINDNIAKAAARRLESLPETPLLLDLYVLAKQHSERFAEQIAESFGVRLHKQLQVLRQTEHPDPHALTQALNPNPESSTTRSTLRAPVELVDFDPGKVA